MFYPTKAVATVAVISLVVFSCPSTNAATVSIEAQRKPFSREFGKRADIWTSIRDLLTGRIFGDNGSGGSGPEDATLGGLARDAVIFDSTALIRSSGIDSSTIDLYAAYAGAAYELNSDKWSCGVQCTRPGTEGTLIKHRWSIPIIASTGYIAVNPNKKVIVVAFRGSADLGDWVEDVATDLIQWPKSVVGSHVGMGFYSGYQIASALILQIVRELTVLNPDYLIVTTGHSLGGARASIFAADIAANHPQYLSRLQLYTYGQPQCGDKTFAKFMDNLPITKVREVYKADIAPHLPGEDRGYYHFAAYVTSLRASGVGAQPAGVSKAYPRPYLLQKRVDILGDLVHFLGGGGSSSDGSDEDTASPAARAKDMDADRALAINHPGITKATIDLYAAYASAAYSIDSENWNCDTQCKRPGMEGTIVKYHWSYPGVTSDGYIAVNDNKKIIVVAFRGSANTGDWIESFSTSFVQWPTSISGSHVSTGFLEGYQVASGPIIQHIKALVTTYPGYTIVATGHSLGGARASMFVADIAAYYPQYLSRIQLFTYGQPKCGDLSFATFMNGLSIPKIREVNKSDITPHLPDTESNYYHFGTEVWIKPDGQYIVYKLSLRPSKREDVLIYRGSVVTGDWVEDFTANLVDWPENVPGSRVGMGFLQGYQAANPKAIQTVADLAVEYPTYRIIVAGHSLGGARAGLLVAELLLGHPELKSRTMLFTYGQPKCGNAEFAEYMNKLGIPLIREVNKSDLVPHLPIPELGYVHFGTEVWALSDSQYIVCQSGDYAKCSENIEPAELNTKEHFQYKWML
ncbi:hypothetical protein GGI07_001467 [Coemansia sp. Benny D115]|nr:hypothetical protein GGI07_001467 [Coemansia sp. Benny D115]